MNKLTLIIGIFLLLSCEKDPTVSTPTSPSQLAEYIGYFNSEKTTNNVWLHAGNHPAFERETDQRQIHIRVSLPINASDIQLHICDSVQYQDSLELFRTSNQEVQIESGGLFGKFAIKYTNDNRPRLARVSFLAGDSLYISPSIVLRSDIQSTNTKFITDLEIETTSGGRAYINWSGAGIDEPWKNLVIIKDQTGIPFCAVETDNLSFLFHNLRNVTKNFTPTLSDARLQEGQAYSLAIYRNDNAGWMRNFIEVGFVADSTKTQIFND